MRALHKIFGFELPSADDYLYQLTVSGIRRDKGHVVCQASPMTPKLLVSMSQFVNLQDGVQYACWIAISGFYLLFHKANLVLDTCVTFDPTKQVTRLNLVYMKDCYIAWVYWAKTIQYHDRCLEIPMLPNPDLRLCPVFWLDRYLSSVPALLGDPVPSL